MFNITYLDSERATLTEQATFAISYDIIINKTLTKNHKIIKK